MKKHQRRKIFLFGRYSLALLPPKAWLREMGVETGDEAELAFDRKKQRIIVSFPLATNSRQTQQPPKKPGAPADHFPAAEEPQEGDWQPIPQL